eukprot:14785613-Alexandrium_andersonii.AAC.1
MQAGKAGSSQAATCQARTRCHERTTTGPTAMGRRRVRRGPTSSSSLGRWHCLHSRRPLGHPKASQSQRTVSYTHLRAHETSAHL